MTSPGGTSGITAPVDSVSSTGASTLDTNTQTNVIERKKSEVQSSPGWNGASNTLFGLLFGGFITGITGFISFLVMALKGVTGGLIDLTGLLSDTQDTANNAAETAAAASNLAVLYNFDVAVNRDKYPATGPYSFPSVGYSYSGSNVALLQPVSGYPAYATQPLGPEFRVTPEEKIYVEWRQRRVGANFQARPVISIRDSTGAVIDAEPAIMAVDENGDPVAVQPLVTATDNAWAKYSGVITIPTGAYTAIPQLRLQSAGGLALAGAWAFDNVIIRRAAEADLSEIEAQLGGKANYSDVPTNVPLWKSINPTDDVVFPISENVFHTSNANDSGSTSETRLPVFATDSGEMDLGFIRAERDRSYLQVGMMTSRGGMVGSGPFELWLHLYKMNPANGQLNLLWNSGNVKAAVQAAGAGNQVRFNMPQIEAEQGDIFAVGCVQRANALNASYSLYGKKQPYVQQVAGVYPGWYGGRVDVGTTFPSAATIAHSSIIWTDDRVPWFVLG